jgi:hypothetical protein
VTNHHQYGHGVRAQSGRNTRREAEQVCERAVRAPARPPHPGQTREHRPARLCGRSDWRLRGLPFARGSTRWRDRFHVTCVYERRRMTPMFDLPDHAFVRGSWRTSKTVMLRELLHPLGFGGASSSVPVNRSVRSVRPPLARANRRRSARGRRPARRSARGAPTRPRGSDRSPDVRRAGR